MFSEYRLRNGTVRRGGNLSIVTSIASDAKFVNAAFALRLDVATPPVAGGGAGGKEEGRGGRELGLNSAI